MNLLPKAAIRFLLTSLFGLLLAVPVAASQTGEDLPLPARLTLQKAQLLLQQKEALKAIELLESFRAKGMQALKGGEADRKGVTHYLIDFNLGNACLMLERRQEATVHYRSALKKNPDFSAGWQNLAKCHYDLNRHLEAARCFLKGYDTAEEKQPELLYYSAVSFLAADRPEKSVDIFDRLIASHRNQIELEWKAHFVHACLACKKNRKALPFIEELAQNSSGKKKTQWQEVLLYQYVALDMKAKARNYAETLTRQFPLEPKWWKALVHIDLLENRHGQALVALTIYSFLTPLSREEKKLMADLNAALGIPLQAARYYEEVLREKMDPQIIKRLVYACLNRHKPEEALRFAEKGLQIQTAAADFRLLQGRILYEMERFPEAAAAFEAATLERPEMEEAWLMLGYAAWNMEDTAKAKHAFQKALNSPKHRQRAEELLDRLKKQNVSARR